MSLGRHRARGAMTAALLAVLPLGSGAQEQPTVPPLPSEPAGAAVTAESGPAITWGAELDTNRRYVWLAQPFSDGPVLQPSLWATRGAWTINGWGSFNLDPLRGSELRLAELDLILSWAGSIGPLQTTIISDTYYWHAPTTKFVNTEIFVRTGIPVGKGELFAVQLLDLHRYSGSYHVALGGSISRGPPNRRWVAQGTLGWSTARFNASYFGVHQAGLLEAALDVSYKYDVSRHVYLRVHVGLTTIVDPALRAAQARPTHLTPGFAIGLQ